MFCFCVQKGLCRAALAPKARPIPVPNPLLFSAPNPPKSALRTGGATCFASMRIFLGGEMLRTTLLWFNIGCVDAGIIGLSRIGIRVLDAGMLRVGAPENIARGLLGRIDVRSTSNAGDAPKVSVGW